MARLILLLFVSSVAAGASAQTGELPQRPGQTPPTPVAAPPEPATQADTPTDPALPQQPTLPTQATTRAPTATPGPAPKAPERREPPQTLMFTMSLSGSDADDSVTGGATAGIPIPGFHTDADAMVTYQHKQGRATIGAVGRSVFRYAPSSEALTTASYDQGELTLSLVTHRDQFQGRQMVSYSPYYQFGALPDATPSALTETAQSHGDFANSTLRALSSTTSVDYSRTFSRRDTLAVAYNLRRTTFENQDLDLTYQNASVRLIHRLTRTMALRTGYGFAAANSTFTGRGSLHNHNLDLGLDYSRALGSSKRTTFSFGSGAAATPSEDGISFHPTGAATLTREMGRTWRARLAASRRVELLEGFAEPLLTNDGIFDVVGNVSRRVSASASARYSVGEVGVDAPGTPGYGNWAGAIGLRLMLSRRTALETQYNYYGHRFDQGVQLAPGVVSGLKRQGLRVSLTWLQPVLQ